MRSFQLKGFISLLAIGCLFIAHEAFSSYEINSYINHPKPKSAFIFKPQYEDFEECPYQVAYVKSVIDGECTVYHSRFTHSNLSAAEEEMKKLIDVIEKQSLPEFNKMIVGSSKINYTELKNLDIVEVKYLPF